MASESFRGLSRLRALADGLCGRGGLAVEPATPHDTGMTLNDLLEFAGRLADAAGDAIRPHFRTRFDVETKTDSSPVTVADRAAEAAMRALIESAFPADGIIGEDYGNVREDAGRVWVLAPIAGARRKSVVSGKSVSVRVDLGGRRIIKNKKATRIQRV